MASRFGRYWSDEEIARAQAMRHAGATYAVIAIALGRSEKAVQDYFSRRLGARSARPIPANGYLGFLDGPPIEDCPKGKSLKASARTGSEMLAALCAELIERHANENGLTLEQAVGHLLYGRAA